MNTFAHMAGEAMNRAIDRHLWLMVWEMEHPKPSYMGERKAYLQWKRDRRAALPMALVDIHVDADIMA